MYTYNNEQTNFICIRILRGIYCVQLTRCYYQQRNHTNVMDGCIVHTLLVAMGEQFIKKNTEARGKG